MDLPFCTTSENVKPDVKVFLFTFFRYRFQQFFVFKYYVPINQRINQRDTVVYMGRT